jgi:uncharacterized protein
MRLKTIALAVTTFTLSPWAELSSLAASFDCAATSQAREKLIRSNPILSQLDEELSRVVRDKLTLLTPHGAELLKRSQENWLTFASSTCPLDSLAWENHLADCLQLQLQERLFQLRSVAEKIGPYVFNRIDLFATSPAPAGDPYGSRPGFSIQHAAYPQVDNLDTPEVVVWNKRMQRDFDTIDCGIAGDGDVSYGVGYASDELISVAWTHSVYCHGTPHGTWLVESENLVLRPTLHALQATDLFGYGFDWVPEFRRLVLSTLQARGFEDDDPEVSLMLPIAIDPQRWVFTRGGIEIPFSAYEIGCYGCTPDPITLTWAELRPLLGPQSVAP